MDNPKNKQKEKPQKQDDKKKLESILRQSVFLGLFLLFAFLIISYGPDEFSLSRITGYVTFTSGPTMDSVATDEDLECSWAESPDTINITVTWLKNNVYFSNETGNVSTLTSPVTLLSSNTAKDEEWTCSVTLFNATDNVTENISITVENTRPAVPVVYNDDYPLPSGIGSAFSLNEDTTYNFTINATDIDNDDLTYEISDNGMSDICSIYDTDQITCLLEHADLLNDSNEEELTIGEASFIAKDGDDQGVENKDVTFTSIPLNDNPEITIIGTLMEDVDVDTEYVQNFSVTDEEDDPYDLTLDIVKLEGPDESPGIASYIEIDFDNEQVYLNSSDGTAGIYDYGTYNITINAIDSSDSSVNASYTYELVINSTNHPPNITEIGVQSGVQGQPFLINLNAFDIDLNETLNFYAVPDIFSTFTNYNNYAIGNTTYLNDTLNITALTNGHIVNRNFTIWIYDKLSATDSIEVNAQLNNTNDAPLIYDISDDTNNINYASNNITNLTAYMGTQFTYYINFTDVDLLTYENESLFFEMNLSDSAFNLTNNGMFTFYSLDDSYIGNYSINITVHDDGTANDVQEDNLSYSKIMSLHIENNTNPYFTYIVDNLTCYEDLECYLDINGTDDDIPIGDSVNYSIGDVNVINNYGNSSFTLNTSSSTGVINFTPPQAEVGNYSVEVLLTDSRGAEVDHTFNLTIINTNDAPVLVTPISFPGTIFVDVPFYSENFIQANDDDLDVINSTEELIYTFNISPSSPDVFILNNLTGTVRINTSAPDCNKTYDLTITVNDTSGVTNTTETNFTIYPRGYTPKINSIYPYGNISNNNSLILDWNDSLLVTSGGITTLITDEGDPIIFNHTTTDLDDTNLTYNWTINDIEINDSRIIEDGHTLNFTNGYFSNGIYDIMIEINDSSYNSANWTWNLTINNVNRAPELINPLPNFTGTRSFSYIEITNYFTLSSLAEEEQRFYDPDFDVNSNNLSDDDEVSGLTYNYSDECDTYAIITIENDSIIMSGRRQGNCTIIFTAYDSENLSAVSNPVTLNVTSEYTIPEPEDSPSSGSSSSRAVPIDMDNDDEPVPLQIVSPKSVVMYKNVTMIIPIELINNWTTQLRGISISIDTNETKLEYSLNEDYINVIPVGESIFVNLTLYNYREPGSYELNVKAQVTNPDFEDSATIIINSLEESYKGETLETKLAFARDLLESNDDCKELFELLDKAETSLKEGNQEKAVAFLDLTINGCKYMISEKDLITTKDKSGKINLVIDHNFLKDLFKNKTNLIIGSVILIIIIIGLLFLRKYKQKKGNKEEEEDYEQEKQEEIRNLT